MFGPAPSEVAAQVLAEDGRTTANTHRWLGAQSSLDAARPGAPDRFGDGALRLAPATVASGHSHDVRGRAAQRRGRRFTTHPDAESRIPGQRWKIAIWVGEPSFASTGPTGRIVQP